jgi:hypothetical protein
MPSVVNNATLTSRPRQSRSAKFALLSMLVVAGFCLRASGQLGREGSTPAPLIPNIQAGDVSAILAAGATGNTSYITALLAYRREKAKRSKIQDDAVQLALAKLGREAELQEVRCELLFGSSPVRYHALDKLDYVGGWFSIESITRVLDSPQRRAYRAESSGTYASIGWYSVRRLHNIVPNPPAIKLGALADGSEQDLEGQREWKAWIRAHEASLNNLFPTGRGIETSSNICQAVLKHGRAFGDEAIKTARPGRANR